MLSLMWMSVAMAFEPPTPEPEISNGFRAEQPEDASQSKVFSRSIQLPVATEPPNPEPAVQRVFLTDETTMSKVRAMLAAHQGVEPPMDAADIDDWPLPVNDIEAALMMVNAWQTPQGSWRIRGGEPWLRVDDVFLRSTME